MPRSKKKGWIDWTGSAAQEMILNDMELGGVLHGQDNIDPEEVFEYYKTFPEFEFVCFDQFKVRLAAYRANAKERNKSAKMQLEWLAHDRQLYPRQTKNGRGEPVFDMSPAKEFLRQDVADEKHLQMTTEQLRLSNTAYLPFKHEIFAARIKQEVRRQKFIYYMNRKQTKKQRHYADERKKHQKRAEQEAKQKAEQEKKIAEEAKKLAASAVPMETG